MRERKHLSNLNYINEHIITNHYRHLAQDDPLRFGIAQERQEKL